MNHRLSKTAAFAAAITVPAMFSAIPASAQQQPDEPAYVIEEIVVTSQKREENLQEVPISITALSETMIEDRGIKNIQDMFSSAPGLTGFEAVSSRGNISVNMRGIGSGNPNNISLDPANAIYIDGVFLGKATGIGVDAGDLQRIEILRGPQGTLYGRNSTGGAINFITRKPAGDLNFRGSATAGSDGLQEYRLRLDLPALGETFSTSFSVQSRQRDELYDNTNPNSPGFENIDRLGYRFAARWEPTDNFRADYSFDHSEVDNENTHALQNVGMNPLGAGVLGAPGFPTMVGINSTNRVAALAATQGGLGFLPQTPQVMQLNQWISDYLAWDAAGRAQFARDPGSIRQDFGSADSAHFSDNEVDGHALTLTWNVDDLGAFGDVEFKSITGFRQTDGRNESDLDGIDNSVRAGAGGLTNGVVSDLTLLTIGGLFFDQISPFIPGAAEFGAAGALVDAINTRGRAETFATFQETEHEQFTQEIQMVGTTDNLEYAVGYFYYDDDGERRANNVSLFPIAFSANSGYTNSTTAWSLYSQVTWYPSLDSPFSITGGLRYTDEEKKITYLHRSLENPAGFFGPFFAGMSPAVTYSENADAGNQPEVAGIFGRSFSQDFTNTSGKLTLAYNFTDTINAFATYSTGYRSGGFNGDAFDVPGDTADAFNEETIENFEIGFKSDLWGGRARLNGTYFTYTYEDIQVSTLLELPNGTVTSNTDNAGEADRSGVELEFTLLPTENLMLALNLATFDGDFEVFPPVIVGAAGGGAVLPTNDLAQRSNPDTQVSFNVDWTIAELNNGSLLQFNVNGDWRDEGVSIALNSGSYDTDGDGNVDAPVAFEQLPIDERTLVNARLALNEIPLGNGSLSLGLWGRNIFDEDYNNFSFNYGTQIGLSVAQTGEPATYGFDLIYRYE